MLFLLLAQEVDGAFTLADLWNQVAKFLTEKGAAFALNFLVALLILLVGRWVAKLIRRIAMNLMQRAKVDETLSRFLGNIIYAGLLVLVIIAAVGQLGIDTTSLAAVLAAGGIAIGLALKDSLGNFASGVMLVLLKPFAVGDFVNAGGISGIVEEIHIFSTRLRTPDNIQITIPNGQIGSGAITNYSAKDTRRIDLTVGCSYQDDLRAVRECLEELIAADERILDDPEPVIAVEQLGASSVDFIVRPWVARSDYADVRWELNEKIKLAFDQRGFTIPYPQQDIHVHGMPK